jgi:AcrR family transcriptional regulator
VISSPTPISGDFLDFPDALAPFNSARCGRLPRRGMEIICGRPVERRASVLAATRRRLAERGPDKVTLRMIAADCGISVQTIFNLIGNRSQLLSAAINDYGRVIKESAMRRPDIGSGILTFVDSMWLSAASNPIYMRQASLSYSSLGSDAHESIRRGGIETVRMLLLHERHRFRFDIDINLLADALESMVAAAMGDWALGRFDLLDLRKHLAFRASALLHGTSRTSEFREL